jgi:hypothetical protein
MSLNNLLQQMYFLSGTSKAGGKKGITKTFNWSIFDTLAIVPTMEVECTNGWAKHKTYLAC